MDILHCAAPRGCLFVLAVVGRKAAAEESVATLVPVDLILQADNI